jgi:hypothetical protein
MGCTTVTNAGGYLPDSTITTYGANLVWNPGPVFNDPREPGGKEYPIDAGFEPSVMATGITDNGIVEGNEQY